MHCLRYELGQHLPLQNQRGSPAVADVDGVSGVVIGIFSHTSSESFGDTEGDFVILTRTSSYLEWITETMSSCFTFISREEKLSIDRKRVQIEEKRQVKDVVLKKRKQKTKAMKSKFLRSHARRW
eukprot:TRINITY_DN3801_c0_g3_i1.p1 TRINITY_DN3801_c0_g3~~TRINITY_DN3801_c0_g3_i1.p1  ORF type:complete len:125 (+),score=19.10 TRINITY_DN3801_c0_g3_i1:84-458(+)